MGKIISTIVRPCAAEDDGGNRCWYGQFASEAGEAQLSVAVCGPRKLLQGDRRFGQQGPIHEDGTVMNGHAVVGIQVWLFEIGLGDGGYVALHLRGRVGQVEVGEGVGVGRVHVGDFGVEVGGE